MDASQQDDLFGAPDSARAAPATPAAEIKASVFTLPVLAIRRPVPADIRQAVAEILARPGSLLDSSAVLLDLGGLGGDAGGLDLQALAADLREAGLYPAGVLHGEGEPDPALLRRLKAAGLGLVAPPRARRREPPPAAEPVSGQTLIVHHPVRSGQQVYARGGDLVVLAPVNAGAEVVADGSIHVYAPLRGRALAGVRGGREARVFALELAPELVAIAGIYRMFERGDELPPGPAQAWLEGEHLRVAPLGRS